MTTWHLTADELPPLLAPVEAVWSDWDEPSTVAYIGFDNWIDNVEGHGVPVPLKWREVEE